MEDSKKNLKLLLDLMRRNAIVSWYASFSVIIGPILQPYNLFGKSVALLLMFTNIILFMLYGVVKGFKSFNKPDRTYIIFLAYFLTLPVMIGVLLYKVDIGASYRGILVFSASLLCYISFADMTSLKRVYCFFVYFAVVVFFAQEFCWYFLGFRFPGLIPFFEINYDMGMEEFLKDQLMKDRSSSIFLEPAHLAIFTLPYLIMKIVDNEEQKILYSFETLFISFFLIWLRSGLGFACLLVIYLIFLLRSRINSSRKVAFILYGSILSIAVLTLTDLGTFLYESFFSRSAELTGNSSNGSGFIRITRGFLVYEDFPLIGKIFGVSNGAIADVVTHSSAYNLFNDDTQLNTIQKILIGYGFIGTILLYNYLHKIAKRRNQYSFYLVLILVIICFMENMLFDSRMLIYVAIAAIPTIGKNKIIETV